MSAIGRAHGRVNLIGEHTDYNGGFVLPALIPQETVVKAGRKPGQTVRVRSATLGDFTFELGSEKAGHHWADYVQGVTRILSAQGIGLSGMELEISSTVPIGSGLSSSAALNLALMRAFRALFGFALGDREMALLCQKVENDFVGARVGIMDPMACALAKPGHALFVDTRSLATEDIPLPANASLIVIHSGVSHRNVGGGYNERRAQCEEAAGILGVVSLRELELSRLGEYEGKLRPLVFRRVRHVLTENQRVLDFVAALKTGALEKAGALLGASHRSLRDDYEVSIPPIDVLVDCLSRQTGVFGARMTGGGFGGSVVALAGASEAATAAMAAAEEYVRASGETPVVLVPVEIYGG
jgi:galactokinase